MAKKEFLSFEGLQRLVDNINALKANIDSPIFKGEPTSPTPNINDKSTRIATTEYVNNIADKFKLEVGELKGDLGNLRFSITENNLLHVERKE